MAEAEAGVFVYVMNSGNGDRHLVSPLPNAHVFAKGLPYEAIMGELTQGPDNIAPEHFEQNEAFVRFLGTVIAKHAASCPGVVAEANRQRDGYVYILDLRTPTPNGEVPPEDIIGGVEVQDSKLLRFHASPKYRVLTKDGFMKLDGWLRERLIEELVALPSE